jgi:hypothetical protein
MSNILLFTRFVDDLEQMSSSGGIQTQSNDKLKNLIIKGFQTDGTVNGSTRATEIDKQINFDNAQFQNMIHVFD